MIFSTTEAIEVTNTAKETSIIGSMVGSNVLKFARGDYLYLSGKMTVATDTANTKMTITFYLGNSGNRHAITLASQIYEYTPETTANIRYDLNLHVDKIINGRVYIAGHSTVNIYADDKVLESEVLVESVGSESVIYDKIDVTVQWTNQETLNSATNQYLVVDIDRVN